MPAGDPFVALALPAARAQALETRRLLVVAVVDAYTDACRTMAERVWPDPALVAWLGTYAIAIQIDRDDAHAHGIAVARVPTTIAYGEDVELERLEGPRRADTLIAWLDRLATGASLVAEMRRGRVEPDDRRAALAEVLRLLASSRAAEALALAQVLWRRHQAEGGPIDGLAQVFGELVRAYPPARAVVEAARAEIAPRATGPVSRDAFSDWLHLNAALGDTGALLAWWDARRDAVLDYGIVDDHVAPALIAAGRWRDAGAAIVNPGHFARGDGELAAACQHVRALAAAGRAADVERAILIATAGLGRFPDVEAGLAAARATGEADRAR